MKASTRVVVLLALVGAGLVAPLVAAATGTRAPALLVPYREAMLSWFPPASIADLDAIVLASRTPLRPGPVGLAVADHAARRFAPLALDANDWTLLAARLRWMSPIRDVPSARSARATLAATRRALERTPATTLSARGLATLSSVIAAQRAVAVAIEIGRECLEPPRPGHPRRWSTSPSSYCLVNATLAMDHASASAEAALAAGARADDVIPACLISLQELAEIGPR